VPRRHHGTPTDREHDEVVSGDTLQAFEIGLAYFRPSTGTVAYAIDGAEHWVVTEGGVLYRTTPDVEPPPDAMLLTDAARPTPTTVVHAPEPGLVLHVVDGDAIDVHLDGAVRRVRVIGVDTPETVAPGQPVEFCGPEASAFTRRLLEGRTVELERDVSEIDRYGRLVRYVWLDGELVCLRLVRERYARW
jgi:endonuclease YncB( thermonuclease family)